jgi:hypothetical protein
MAEQSTVAMDPLTASKLLQPDAWSTSESASPCQSTRLLNMLGGRRSFQFPNILIYRLLKLQ